MQQNFQQFQNILINKAIEMYYDQFIPTVYKFSFSFLSNENINNLLSTKTNSFEFIVIDQKIDQKKEKFIFICFNFSLFIINISELSFLHTFLCQNKGSIIYCLDDKLQDTLQSSYKSTNFNFSKDDLSIFINKEIQGFLGRFQIKNRAARPFWEYAQDSIAGFLIKQSYSNSYFERIRNKPSKFEQELNNIEYNEKEFVYLRTLEKHFSSVELYYHIDTCKLFVLKVPQNESLSLIERERNNYLSVQHLFLLKYYGYSIIFNLKSLAIEFINGEGLDKIKKLNFDRIDKLCIIYELIFVLRYIHSCGFIYRDLKPNNIMIDKDKTMILIDLDRLFNSKMKINENKITRDFGHCYVAPELFNQTFSFSADIYSFGLILYFIVTEKDPDVSKLVFDFPPEFLILTEICNQCIKIDPKERPTIDEIMNKFESGFLFNKEETDEVKKRLIKIHDNVFFYENKDKKIDETIYKLGKLHQEMMIPNHLKKYFEYIQMAADMNNRDALKSLGDEYFDGNIIRQNINKAILYYTKAADLHCEEALVKLGKIYYLGLNGVEKDYEKSFNFFNEAIEQNNNITAMHYLASICMESRQYEAAMYFYLFAAELNDASALYNVGVFHLIGFCCEKNINKGMDYLFRSANQNYDLALYQLGRIYFDGKIFPKDMQKALYYYEKAADLNDIEACYELGVIYSDDFIGHKNINKSIYYYKIAAEMDHVQANYNLGVIYYKGKIVEKDIDKSIYHLSKALKKQSDHDAEFLLGYIYSDRSLGYKDTNKAIHYLSLSANSNNPKAQYCLAGIYKDGIDVPIDIDKAIYYYQKALKSNFFQAQYELGEIYLEHKKDINKAVFYFELSANNNDNRAQYRLGILYLRGEYFHMNINKAIHYLQLSASSLNQYALVELGYLYNEGKYVSLNIEKAIHYYELAANQDNPEAQANLAFAYFETNKTQNNINKTIYYFKLAAKNGSTAAKFSLGTFYYEGNYVDRDIDQAIHYFKDASNMNYQYAKNSLGIIYKNGDGVKANIKLSIEYFIEAIKKKNDVVSMYNLAHIYFFEEGVDLDLDIAMYYLKNSLEIKYSLDLFCLALVKKYQVPSMTDIENELNDIPHNSLLAQKIYYDILNQKLEETDSYHFYYNLNSRIELVYDIFNNYHIRQDPKEKKNDGALSKNLENINYLFYEGLGKMQNDL